MRLEAVTASRRAEGPSSRSRCSGSHRPWIGSGTCQLQELRGHNRSGNCCFVFSRTGSRKEPLIGVFGSSRLPHSPQDPVWSSMSIASQDFRSQKALTFCSQGPCFWVPTPIPAAVNVPSATPPPRVSMVPHMGKAQLKADRGHQR